jgi:integrase
MGAYFTKGKGWRYDFMMKGQRITGCWFKTEGDAKQAEATRTEEILDPPAIPQTSTGMDFLELVNRRLDHIKAYFSEPHYFDHRGMAKRWVQNWGSELCGDITQEVIERFALKRLKVSPHVANKEIKSLRATFRFGKKKKWIASDPTEGISFFPVEKRVRYVPQAADIEKAIAVAKPDMQDYLWTMRDTLARMSEINRLTWRDIDLGNRSLVLYTRKKRGGHLTPKTVPLTNRLFGILSRRYAERDPAKPWVFWHTYHSSKTGEKLEGPFRNRKRIMKTLCRNAGVAYFRYHAIRHAGASAMDSNNVPIGATQRILGHENRTTTEIYYAQTANMCCDGP